MNRYRNVIVAEAQKWLGCNERDSSHKKIIDIYNNHRPLPRGYLVKYNDSWCATFVSSVAIVCGYTDIIPKECGCEEMIKLFQKLGEWVENDAYVPMSGDVIFYDWDDSGVGDCKGYSDHVGYVESCDRKNIVVIEGNKNDAVERRIIPVNAKCIRGYGAPPYDEAVAELVSVNDIVWELAHRGIISEPDKWLKKLPKDTDVYWLARKFAHYIRQHV